MRFTPPMEILDPPMLPYFNTCSYTLIMHLHWGDLCAIVYAMNMMSINLRSNPTIIYIITW